MVSCVGDTALKLAAAPPNITDLEPVNVFPVTVNTVPAAPLVADNELIVGRTPNVNPALVPPGVTTTSDPVSAPSDKFVVVIWVAESTLAIGTGSAPSFSRLAPSRFDPDRVSASPACAGAGTTSVSFGTGLNEPTLTAVPVPES